MPQEIDPQNAPEAPVKQPVIISNDPRVATPQSSANGPSTSGSNSTIPVERLDLPSRGALYASNNPARSGSILVRPITTAEEEILVTERFAKQGTTIDMILSRCIVTRGINTLDLLAGDRAHILFYLRAISYGPDYEFTATLKGGVQQVVKTNVAQLKVKILPPDFVEPYTIQIDGDTYEIVLLRGHGERAIAMKKMIQKQRSPDAADPGLSEALIQQLKTINGEGNTDANPNFISNHVRSMIARKASKLRNEIIKVSPGPVLKQDVINRETGELESVTVQVTENFFRSSDDTAGENGSD